MSDISELVTYLNQSNGIPLTLTTTTITNWWQYSFTLLVGLIGGFFVLIYLWDSYMKPIFSSVYVRFLLRKTNIQKGRPTILIKHTQQSLFSASMIDQNTLQDIIKYLNELNGKDFDLVLYTPGGNIFAGTYISRLLKMYPGKINAIVPVYAMSGGTLLALSCDEIHMNEHSCLGPIDPQLGTIFSIGSAKSWNRIKKFKGKKADDNSIAMDFVGQQYTKSIKDYLNYLVENKLTTKQRKEFVKFMTEGNIEHAHPLTIEKLAEFGLSVKKIDPIINDSLMKIVNSKMLEGVYLIK